ncbi:zf-HC2 domain-containing protein [Streptomyces sp. NPDC050095]|uniref:anti-sigma factor family protein n=1 Tax=unclassified Streptomyces TaxID=2593676 RepID=UPI00344313DF
MTRDERSTHVPDDVLQQYVHGELPPGPRQEIEPHLDACAHCCDRLLFTSDPVLLNQIWVRVDEAIDVPVPGSLERLLLRLHVPDHVARLTAATPALRGSWLGGAALTLVFAALLARLAGPAGAHLVYLAMAPLLPVAGVAVSFGRRWDPAYEVGLVAPTSALRLVLSRSTVVLGTSLALSAGAALTLPHLGLSAFAWLLPSCALTALSVALSARLDQVTAACTAGAGWLLFLVLTLHTNTATSPLGQAAIAGVLLASIALMSVLRADFDTQKVIRQ